MNHWNEIRMFLAVAEGGSVRAAAESLGLNHATILRGIARLESELGATLYDRLPSGYRLTDAGVDIVELAGQMATASMQIEARISGRDKGIYGPLRLTLPAPFATDLLMPSLVEFRRSYPGISLEIIGSGSLANLGKREADIALRVVVNGSSLPENLYGRKLCGFRAGHYIRRDQIIAGSHPSAWLLGPDDTVPMDWQPGGGIVMSEAPMRFSEMRSLFTASREGMGIAFLPCFVGDADPNLVRVPRGPVPHVGDVWLLTHADIRGTRRANLLSEHLRATVKSVASRIEGHLDA